MPRRRRCQLPNSLSTFAITSLDGRPMGEVPTPLLPRVCSTSIVVRDCGSADGIRRAMPSPNSTDQRRTVSYVSSMPRAASSYSIMRRLSGKR